jgi:polysaccharide pyruvyl transferase WcaK-like protein
MGWYGHKNCGDEAYKSAFPKLFPDHQLTFSDQVGKITDLKPYQAAIVGGGNVIDSDFLNEGKPLRKSGLPIHGMSINVINEAQAARAKVFKSLTVRDTSSLFHSPEARYLPDYTFVLKGDKMRGQALLQRKFDEQKAEKYQKIVLVCLNAHLLVVNQLLAKDHATLQKVIFDLADLFDNTSASFVLLPFCNGFPYNDCITNGLLYAKCKFWKKNLLVYDPLSVQDMLDIYTAADAAINTRLHASIFSTIGGTPFIDLLHHDKNRVYLDSVRRSQWGLDYWRLDIAEAKRLLQHFLGDNGQTESKKLLQIAEKNRQMLVAATSQMKL